LALGACAALSPRTVPLAQNAASAGIAATNAALKSYDQLDDLYGMELRSRKTGDVLTNPGRIDYSKAASLSPKEEAIAVKRAESIELRREAARNLQETYRAFNRLTSGEFGNDASVAISQLNSTAASLAAAAHHPLREGGPIPSIAGGAAQLIIGGFQARDIRRHNRALAELVREFRSLWDSDLRVWEQEIDAAYVMELPKSLAGLADSDFDQGAVARMVSEPLSPALKLRLYRMKILNDAAGDAEAAKGQLRDVSAALGATEDAHEELAKDHPSLTDVVGYVDHAIELSKSAEKENDNGRRSTARSH
jgi:hypothetical protein